MVTGDNTPSLGYGCTKSDLNLKNVLKNGDAAANSHPDVCPLRGYCSNRRTRPSSASASCVTGGDGGLTDDFRFLSKQREVKHTCAGYRFTALSHLSTSLPAFYTFMAPLFSPRGRHSVFFVCPAAPPPPAHPRAASPDARSAAGPIGFGGGSSHGNITGKQRWR